MAWPVREVGQLRQSAVLRSPLCWLRTNCIGTRSASAIHAANGMPAASPPTTESMFETPIRRSISRAASCVNICREVGKETTLRQST